MIRKLTDHDLTNIAGSTVKGYHVEGVRIKKGTSSDSDHYGIILGRNDKGCYVTWQFHLDENEEISVYWGHYLTEDREAALRDFNERDLKGSSDEAAPQMFKVTITETLKLTVEVEAESHHEAEQIASDGWRNSEYILNSDNFAGVEYEAVPVDQAEED